jgi:hypothetical protein
MSNGGNSEEPGSRERRRSLSEDELEYLVTRIVAICGDRIANIAVERTLDKLYVEVGKGVLRRLSLFIGAAVIAILLFLAKNHIDLK